jgi:F420-dependent oxidoreductase-like protein
MRIGLHIGRFDWPGSSTHLSETLTEMAQAADEAGFYSLTVMDHLFQLGTQYGEIHGPFDAPMLEGYSTIAYLAAKTQRIKLGLLVTCHSYRHPGVLIKTVSTIDVLSGGRAYLGIGAGWFEAEAAGLGIPFPPVRERMERLEETLQIAKHMWAGKTSPFAGQHYQLTEPINVPQPLSKPHPPILIGGGGEKKTLRFVAQYADAWNFVIRSPLSDEIFGRMARKEDSYGEWVSEAKKLTRRKLEILRRHCDAVGRPYDEIDKSIVTYIKLDPNMMSAAEVIQVCRDFADMGFGYVMFVILNGYEIEPLVTFGHEIIPVVKEFPER